MTPRRVSIHGGHSGQFCGHAENTLEEVILAYIAKGFTWVGVTEHMPPPHDRFRYREEKNAGLNRDALASRFSQYMAEGRRLQKKYAQQLEIFIGFETETCNGGLDYARQLMAQHRPDYIVGGVHHVDDIPFDSSPADYNGAIAAMGRIETLYCRYFDLQYEMIQTLQPKVIAHFDLIRLFDPEYALRFQVPAVQTRITRNLQLIKQLGLILDFNVAALRKGAAEPYLSQPILREAQKLGIAIVPGDDSHGVDTVGAYIDEGISILEKQGHTTEWARPVG